MQWLDIFIYKASCVRDIYVRACNFSVRTTRARGRRRKYGNSHDKYELALETLCHRRRVGGGGRIVALFFEWSEKELERNDKAEKRREKEAKTASVLQFLSYHVPPVLSDVIIDVARH